MKGVLTRFSDPDLGRSVLAEIQGKAEAIGRPLTFMEVCGTHTAAYSFTGLRDVLDDAVRLRSGPGCPVCVTPPGDIDRMIALAGGDHITCTFGDMMDVPGSGSSLRKERARSGRVRIIYSPDEALQLARGHHDGETVVLLSVGFETTAPAVSSVLRRAAAEDRTNLRVFSAQRLLLPALRVLLCDPEVNLDGLILPGHVAAVLGRAAFEFVGAEAGIPAVVTGFEVIDLLCALDCLLDMVGRGEVAVKNRYGRAVREMGNPAARGVTSRVFEQCDVQWRGLGTVRGGGLRLREEFAAFDAAPLVPDDEVGDADPPEQCRCGDILRGQAEPGDCRLFARICNPLRPSGPCMVSREGACSTYYRHHREESLHG